MENQNNLLKRSTSNNGKKPLRNYCCYYHIKREFQSEYTLYSCLNVKKLLARNKYNS